jgi:hypothetical protein
VAALIVNVLAWLCVAALAGWLLWDFTKTNRRYSEDYLTASSEGVDEFAEVEQALFRSEHDGG